VSKAGADAKAAIKEQRLDLKEQSDRIKTEGEAVSRGFQEEQKKLLEVGGQLPALRQQFAVVQDELKRAQKELDQLPAGETSRSSPGWPSR
jgi:predicted nuclease with TOPRIM domain